MGGRRTGDVAEPDKTEQKSNNPDTSVTDWPAGARPPGVRREGGPPQPAFEQRCWGYETPHPKPIASPVKSGAKRQMGGVTRKTKKPNGRATVSTQPTS